LKDTLEAVEEFERNLPETEPPCFYFIDFFAVNQYDPKKDLDQLGDIVKRSQNLLLIASPWESPATLGRAWVIFELANAVLSGKQIVLTMPMNEKIKFKAAVAQRLTSDGNATKFLEIFSNIDSRNSNASVEEDLVQIRTFIEEKLGGFDSVDQKIANALRLWIGRAVQGFCESHRAQGSRKHGLFLYQSNYIFSFLGMWDCQLKFARQALKIFEDLGDQEMAEAAQSDVAKALNESGRFSEAVSLREDLLERDIKKYGLEHRDTAYSRYNLGISYMRTEQWSKAEDQLRRSWNF